MAQAIGKSTIVIVNLFGSKVGLIDAVSEVALAQDEAFHREFFARLDHLPPGRDALIGVILSYLQGQKLAAGAGRPRKAFMSNTLDRSPRYAWRPGWSRPFSAWP